MTPAQKNLRKQLLCKIHMNSRYKKIKANNAWADWLFIRYEESSCANLSINELLEVLDILNFRTQDRDFAQIDSSREAIFSNGSFMSYAQKLKIAKLSSMLNFSQLDLFEFIKRQLGEYKGINGMSKKEASKVILGLEATLSYRGKVK